MTNHEEYISKNSLTIVNQDDYPSFLKGEKVAFCDSEGYKYFLAKSHMSEAITKGGSVAKFFKNNPFTRENIELYLSNISNGDVTIEEYNSLHTGDPILLRSKKLGRTYYRSWDVLRLGVYTIPKSKEYFKNPQVTLHIDDVQKAWLKKFDATVTSDEFCGVSAPVEFICNKHPEIGVQSTRWSTSCTANSICKQCTINKTRETKLKKASAKFWKDVDAYKNPNVEILGDYVAQNKHIKCRCLKCNQEFTQMAKLIPRGLGHRGCNRSIGESKIASLLDSLGICYETEYVFEDCRMKNHPMPFDFYLPNINTVIEVDGRQHYESVEFFGGDAGLEQVKQRDAFKASYCNNHKINIIRIPYYEVDDTTKWTETLLSVA